MSDFDRNYAAVRGAGADRALAIDAGLRAYMIRVYNTMAAGVALTGVIAWLTFQAGVVDVGQVEDADGAAIGAEPGGQGAPDGASAARDEHRAGHVICVPGMVAL